MKLFQKVSLVYQHHATLLDRPPLMMASSGPDWLVTVILFPWKSIVSWYVPLATSTVSPFSAASIPDWIIGYSPGTWRVAPNAALLQNVGERKQITNMQEVMISFIKITQGCVQIRFSAGARDYWNGPKMKFDRICLKHNLKLYRVIRERSRIYNFRNP